MKIIPAIDIRQGKCVRLVQGDPERETVYRDDPVEQAREFQQQGAELIHVVDLDGAFEGRPVNHDRVIEMRRAVDCNIEIGGGIRNEEAIELYRKSGIERIILGTVILDTAFYPVLERYRDVLVAGIDARQGRVATHGWKNVSDIEDEELFSEMVKLGLKGFIYTDISRDGMLQGPPVDSYNRILDSFGDIELVASGGISSLDDLRLLHESTGGRVAGCIIGKAIYDGRVDLVEAMGYVAS
jgi:phosphoribosylformimino-5-aminoimidazole carboxamide ribotide isomerase